MGIVYPSPGVVEPDLRVGIEEDAEHFGQLAQLLQVGLGQGVEPLMAERSQRQADEALIVGVTPALDEAEVLRPVDEADGAVMPDEQVAGDVGDRGAERVAVAPDGQQQLVLGRRHVELAGLLLAEPAETAQGDPELQDPAELVVGQHDTDPTPAEDDGPSTG